MDLHDFYRNLKISPFFVENTWKTRAAFLNPYKNRAYPSSFNIVSLSNDYVFTDFLNKKVIKRSLSSINDAVSGLALVISGRQAFLIPIGKISFLFYHYIWYNYYTFLKIGVYQKNLKIHKSMGITPNFQKEI